MEDPQTLPEYVGRYKIERFLGQGGMGRLYLAVDPVLGRQLAIKVIREEVADTDVRARFTQEARAAGGLKHPNVVTVFDAGDHEGHPFIAMEYVSGDTLADLIRRALPVPVTTKLHLIAQLCRGLACAHRSELVHRDIKPANLMVDQEGTLKILDFGIAHVAESGLTSTGVAIGTINYMSPEQVAGNKVDHRSDVFSVGTVFHELLTYQPAFPGTIQDGVMYRIVHGESASLRDACPDLDPSIVATVTRAMRATPNERYQDLDTMAEELGTIRSRLDRGVAAKATPTAELETSLAHRSSETETETATLASRRPAGATTGRRRLWWVWAGAAVTLVAAIAMVISQLSRPPEVDPSASSLAAAPGATGTELAQAAVTLPPAVPNPTQRATDAAEPRDELPAPAPDTPAAPVAAPPLSTNPDVDAQDPASATRDRLADQLVAAVLDDDQEATLRAAATLLQLSPDHATASRALDRLEEDATVDTQRARESVDRLGQSSPLYQQARQAETEAEDLASAGERESSIRQLWVASRLFREAAVADVTATVAEPAPRDAIPEPEETTRLTDAAPLPVSSAPDAPAPEDPDVAAARADRAIADALDRYRAAYEQLDGAALQAVYPSVPQDTIDALQGWEAYAVVLNDVATQINGDLATVNGRVSLRLRARTGISTEASGRVVFRLEKQGQTDWLITDIDMSDVR
jgi:serine/threonine-protein kinase